MRLPVYFLIFLSTFVFADERDIDLAAKLHAAAEEVMESALREQASSVRLDSLEVRDLGVLESIQNVLSLGVGFNLGESSKPHVHYQIVESQVTQNGSPRKINCLMRFEFSAPLVTSVLVQKCQNSGPDILRQFSSEVRILDEGLLGNRTRTYGVRLSEQAQWGSQAQVNSQRGVKNYSARLTSRPSSSAARQN